MLLQGGKWDSRMGHFRGKKYMYLGMLGNNGENGPAYDRTAGDSNSGHSATNMPQVWTPFVREHSFALIWFCSIEAWGMTALATPLPEKQSCHLFRYSN